MITKEKRLRIRALQTALKTVTEIAEIVNEPVGVVETILKDMGYRPIYTSQHPTFDGAQNLGEYVSVFPDVPKPEPKKIAEPLAAVRNCPRVKRRLTPADKMQIVAMRRAGETINYIAQEMSCSRMTVIRVCKDMA